MIRLLPYKRRTSLKGIQLTVDLEIGLPIEVRISVSLALRMGISVSLAVEDGYIWKPLANKEDLFKKHLFVKQLSKQSIRVYMELYREVGITFEAASLLNSGNIRGSEGGR
jgi:hypothetical protein